jgi:hypothetical protein
MTDTSYKYAKVIGGLNTSDKNIEKYLPSRFKVENGYLIGIDFAGWTLQGYVIPRLGSGLINVEEITAEEYEIALGSTKRV